VTGNHRVEKDPILAVVSAQQGNRVDYGELDKDLHSIYRMGFFTDVSVHIEDGPMGKIVVFNVAEKPSVAKIVFEGNRKVREEELRREIGIKPFAILDQNEIRQSVNRIRDYYRQKGYYNAEVRERIHHLSENKILVRYEIIEGQKVPIFAIQFAGNGHFSNAELKGLMKPSERGFFSWIRNSGYLDEKSLELDTQEIIAFYHNHGFIKTVVGKPQITWEREKGLRITIEIHEGKRYFFGEVSVEGEMIGPADEILGRLGAPNKKVFSPETVQEDVQVLTDIYADEGYAYVNVQPVKKEDDENSLVHLTYRITRGPRVRIGRINITGNTVTRDKVIRRALKVHEGEYFSSNALRRSIENLRRLGFFEDIEVHTHRIGGKDLWP
jgi:outer membrane protein insertion porin family